MDLLVVAWSFLDAACIGVFLAQKYEQFLPDIIKDVLTWGKTRVKDRSQNLSWFRKICLVPKRWFTHFYILGFVWNAYLLATFIFTCYQEKPILRGFFQLISIMNQHPHSSQLDCFSLLLTLSLITVQMIRRLYESLFVSSYSGKMHSGHYLVGLLFYLLVNLTIVAEIKTPLQKNWCCSCLHLNISWLHVLAVCLFTWASFHQYQCHLILGKLTTWTPNGKKVYKIPHGDWFEYVSSPHYLAEIIIYLALFFTMQGRNQTWLLVFFFVALNLTFGAKVTHTWYQQKFKSYPVDRKVILPYVY